MHKSKWAGNISLNILGNDVDNDIVLKDLFSGNVTKGEKYSHISNYEKNKDNSNLTLTIDNSERTETEVVL